MSSNPNQHILRQNPSPDDSTWHFSNIPGKFLTPPKNRPGWGKLVRFAPDGITLIQTKFPSNRITHNDDISCFTLASFESLRFPDTKPSVSADYIVRIMTAGLFLNGTQYRFYHHSNSQLRSRSCFLRRANSDDELDQRIYALGDFGRIMNVAKRAKRIGLLFSGAEIDFQLDPKYIADIPDLKIGDELFSDGCGLISKRLANQLSAAKGIVFRNKRYTPCVFQIRYKGYKGVLMLHPDLDQAKQHLAEFRGSMKKFTAIGDNTLSAVDYSAPYTFGRLNNDVIVLLASLGITTEALLQKQESYFTWIKDASTDHVKAIDLLSANNRHDLAERTLLKGFDDLEVAREVRRLQQAEIGSFRKNDKMRVRMIIHKSRLLFGVCDPYGVLKEGEVHVRITASPVGATTISQTDVLVVRNPCLHPGDILKLRATYHPKLAHLVDCVVFPSVGKRAAPSMTSGGDLDGDKFFICWDPDIVPKKISESYDYPSNREHVVSSMTRADLAKHFAAYNSMGLARVATLHQKWARASPDGALSSECQELNALHSQSVDGAAIKIPDRLRSPPEAEEPYVIDVLTAAAAKFAAEFSTKEGDDAGHKIKISTPSDPVAAKGLILRLLKSDPDSVQSLSEYELFNMAFALARKFGISLKPYLAHLNVSALTASQKHAISIALQLVPESETEAMLWNSLMRSRILTARDIEERRLRGAHLHMQRLYSSRIQGLSAFFDYLEPAMQDYTRKLLVLKTDDRFAVGIFVRGELPWNEDPSVSDNVVVCSFMPQTSSHMATYRPCTKGFRLHCGENILQLYDKQILNTFIFVSRPPRASQAEIVTSIALQKISTTVQRQLGRLNKTPVVDIEIHVISNRDRIAHQIFDLRFDHVATEEYIKRLAKRTVNYIPNNLKDVEWAERSEHLRQILTTPDVDLASFSPAQLKEAFDFALQFRSENHVFKLFAGVLRATTLDTGTIREWMDAHPPLAFSVMKAFPPSETGILPPQVSTLSHDVLRNLIRSANTLGMAVLVGLEKLSETIFSLDVHDYFSLLELAALSVRPSEVVQEVLFVLNDCRSPGSTPSGSESAVMDYARRQALALALDHAEEAADECPCDDLGKIRKQRTAPTRTRLFKVEEDPSMVKAHVRIDSFTPVRLHSHVRLQAASRPEKGWVERSILDGLVKQASKGEMLIQLMHPPPPEMEQMDWNMYNAGSIATTRAMMDAVERLASERAECCRFWRIIADPNPIANAPRGPNVSADDDSSDESTPFTFDGMENLNDSQIQAVKSCTVDGLSLIWGPPGTGKTTVVVRILQVLLSSLPVDTKILVTASTHNAVDNILERFVALSSRSENKLPDDQILRVATDQSKVGKALQAYTIDARVGGDVHQNVKLLTQAEKRVKAATLVFTTCAGAGLGILRKVDFQFVIIDEASQITEPCALIPLVKGCKRAVLVGDHVQLRPTVKPGGKMLMYDISLLERLYTGPHRLRRTMLNVQYRSPKELISFTSREFYGGNLQTGVDSTVLSDLHGSSFPWPKVDGVVFPTVFVPCAAEEDMGRSSKANSGQIDLIKHIVSLLTTSSSELSLTVLSPYSRQVKMLRDTLPSSCPAYTIDSFQGRESDIIIFSTVRCNANRDIGFLDDARRLNVAWTRAKLGLIIVGDRNTLTLPSLLFQVQDDDTPDTPRTKADTSKDLWVRAIQACRQVEITLPTTEPSTDK